MTGRKLVVRMLIEESKISEVLNFLLEMEYLWIELSIGNKEKTK